MRVAVAVAALAAAGDLPEPERSAEEVRRVADEVLADAVFDRPPPGLLARARDWFFERIGDAVESVLGSAGSGLLGWAVVAMLVLGAVLIVVRFTRGIQRDPGTAVGTPSGPRRPPTDWLADATRFEAAGDWRAGLRCRHRALVASLAASGLVDEVPGRTAGEYRVDVARSVPAVAPDFDGATALFEVAWYGGRAVGAAEAGRFEDLSRRVLAGTGRR